MTRYLIAGSANQYAWSQVVWQVLYVVWCEARATAPFSSETTAIYNYYYSR